MNHDVSASRPMTIDSREQVGGERARSRALFMQIVPEP
ncbi:hypothetical protein AOX55_00004042 [Sinorhizobium fredii CCBAU 25509]|nr:hypothetical protein AOX55_00004042 [Sinorhizobium fredii CCBAU 25509]